MKERLDSNFLPLTLLFNMTKLYSKDLPLQHPFMGSKHVARKSPEFMNLSRKSYKSMPKVLCEEIFGLKLGLKRNRNVSLRASVLFVFLPLMSHLRLHSLLVKVPTTCFISHSQCPAHHIKVQAFIFSSITLFKSLLSLRLSQTCLGGGYVCKQRITILSSRR